MTNLDIEERQLFQELNEIAIEIEGKLDAEHPARDPSNHEHSNWCSEIHHPCELFLVYARRNWQQRDPMDIKGRYRVEDGSRWETIVRHDLEKIGFEVILNQKPVTWPKFQLSGKIDGNLVPPGSRKQYPFEIKLMGANLYGRIRKMRTGNELTKHPSYWINKIPSQLNSYFFCQSLPGGFVVIKTQGERMKILPTIMDYDLAEHDIGRLERVNDHVTKKTYPKRMKYDKNICPICDFHHICQPVPVADAVDASKIGIEILEKYWETRHSKKEHEHLKAQLIGTKSEPGAFYGKNLIIDDFEITSTTIFTKGEPQIRTKIEKMVEAPTPWD